MSLVSQLEKGWALSRTEARDLIAQGDPVVPQLLDALKQDKLEVQLAAAVLLGAMQRAEAAPPIANVLEHLPEDLEDDDLVRALGESLARLGDSGRQELVRLALHAPAPLVRIDAAASLSYVIPLHPELRESVGQDLTEIVKQSKDDVVTTEAVESLCDIGYQQALDVVRQAFKQERIDPDVISLEEAEDSLEHGGRLEALPKLDEPLHEFSPDHTAALIAWRDAFEAAPGEHTSVRINEFFEDVNLLLDSADEDRLLSRLAQVQWSFLGYRMLPSEQLEKVGRDRVGQALDLLSLEAGPLRRRLKDQKDDYLLWAGALRAAQLEQVDEFHDLASRIASSGQNQAALDYPAIERLAKERDADFGELVIDAALVHGDLPEAWDRAGYLGESDPEGGLELFEHIMAQQPDMLWTAAAAAEELGPQVTQALLEEALEKAKRGQSAAHPRVPDKPCPVEVLQGYLDEVGDAT
ncbi:MAG: HEAT repeat domain-containing protein [Candidatus Xenobia bacterium]